MLMRQAAVAAGDGGRREELGCMRSKAFARFMADKGKPITRFLTPEQIKLLEVVSDESQTSESVDKFLNDMYRTEDGREILKCAFERFSLISELSKHTEAHEVYKKLGENYPEKDETHRDIDIYNGDLYQLGGINKLRDAIQTVFNKSLLLNNATTNSPVTLFGSSITNRDVAVAAASFAAGMAVRSLF